MKIAAYFFLTLILTLLLVAGTPAQASQYEQQSGGRTVVVHTRLAPVAAHRAFPPYKGAHVYRGGRPSR